MNEDVKLSIVADENIPFVKEAFSEFGDVTTIAGRSINSETVKEADILVVRSVTAVNKELLEGSSVKFVGTATIGVDHVDVKYLNSASIGFASAVGSNASSVAEYVITAILILMKKGKIPENPVLGIIGAGNVGSELFKRAEGMGIKTLLNDPPKARLTSSDIFKPLEELHRECDIISLHIPLSTDGQDPTYHLVNSNFIRSMKKGALLINSSRGDVMDESSLLQAMENEKTLGGLVMDVWHGEPHIRKELAKHCDIATPHIAGYSWDGKVQGTEMIHDAAAAFFYRESRWHGRDLIAAEKIEALNISTDNALLEAVLQVYNIEEDNKNLRETLNFENEKRGEAFDLLRTNYRRRLEFPHFSVKAEKVSRREREALASLGFHVRYL